LKLLEEESHPEGHLMPKIIIFLEFSRVLHKLEWDRDKLLLVQHKEDLPHMDFHRLLIHLLRNITWDLRHLGMKEDTIQTSLRHLTTINLHHT